MSPRASLFARSALSGPSCLRKAIIRRSLLPLLATLALARPVRAQGETAVPSSPQEDAPATTKVSNSATPEPEAPLPGAPASTDADAHHEDDALHNDEVARENEALRARVEKLEGAVAGLTRLPEAAPEGAPKPAPPRSAAASLETQKQAPKAEPDREPYPLRPTLLGEVDYRVYPSEVEGHTGFAVARLRPGLALAPTPWFRGVGTFEFAGEIPTILDAFARIRASKWAEFTIGYSKPPLFASFIYEPVHALPFPDRAPVVTSFRVRRDVGADVHFTPATVPLEGWVRVGNGSGSPLGNDNASPAGYASLDLVIGRAWTAAGGEEQPFGLRLGGGGLLEDARERNGIVGQTPFGFVYYRPIVVTGLRTVGQGHVVAYAGPLRLTVEGAVARESRSQDTDENPSTPRADLPEIYSYGLTTELSWVILGSPRTVGRAPRSLSRKDGNPGVGALDFALRYDGLWLGRSADDVTQGGSQGGAAALKWWPSEFLAATLFGYATHYGAPAIEAPDESWSWGTLARASFFWGLPGQHQATVAEGVARR
jgi:phosphate-selective porin OprO/OprP